MKNSDCRDTGEDDLDAFEFDLPENFIASRPAVPRGSSRLMILDRAAQSIEHSVFESFPYRLDEGDCLVVNETKVRPCRIFATREETGGKLELLFLRKCDKAADGEDRWEAMVRPSRRLKEGAVLRLAGGATARVAEKTSGATFLVEVPDRFEDYLDERGETPIPPYIRRKADADDREHYQTVYARVAGSSAAPTAGLHFTRETFRRLQARGVEIAKLILHVGPGTFRPLKPGKVSSQKLDPEFYEITSEACQVINRARGRGGRVFAVGTTSARVLETVGGGTPSLSPSKGRTDIFIYPPYEFRTVNALVTNFHLPGSSVLLLACAFAGREFILRAYEEAKREGYRFYSYGDGMLIL